MLVSGIIRYVSTFPPDFTNITNLAAQTIVFYFQF